MVRPLLGGAMLKLNLMDDEAIWCADHLNIYHKMLQPPLDHDFLRADRFDLNHYFMMGTVESIAVHGCISDELAERLVGLLAPGGFIYEFSKATN